jgi:predicted DsbA family dithiol-disulfide isomerase
MHARLFENQKALEPWSGHAEALGLNVAAFDACMESHRHVEAIRADMVEAQKAGATGTPSFVIAKSDPDNPTQVTGVTFLRGAVPYANFKAAIEEALAEEDEPDDQRE